MRREIKALVAFVVAMGIIMLGLSAAAAQEKGLEERAEELAKLATTGRSSKVEGSPMIGLAMTNLEHAGWLNTLYGVLRGVAIEDCGLTTVSANKSAELQMSQMEDFIATGVDAILLNPVDAAALSKAVEKANRAGIPVVCVDRSTLGGEVAALCESANVECGRQAARMAARIAEERGIKLKFLNITGDLSASSAIERDKGFTEEVKNQPNLEIVATLPGEWKEEVTMNACLDGFQAHLEINAVYLPSDCIEYKPVEAALRQMGKLYPVGHPKHVVIVGVDGCPIMLKAIEKGYADGTAVQQLDLFGEMALNRAISAVRGYRVEKEIHRISPIPTTKENVNDPKLWGNRFKIGE